MHIKLNSIIGLLAVVFFACNKQPESRELEVAGVQVPEIILNGQWKFNMDPPDEFWSNGVDFQNWPDIQVPGECQMQGFAIKHDRPYAYKHQFMVPADFEGKHIQLNFHGVYSYARVWVNGQYVRDHFGGFTKWTCDITDLVRPGEKAVLTVEIIDRADDISYGSGYAKHQIGGILRDVALTALPKQHFQQLYFETELDEQYQNANLEVFYELSQKSPSTVKIELLDADRNLVEKVEKEVASASGSISIAVENPLKWDAEHPHLYTLVTTLFQDGATVLKRTDEIGFREVVVEGNKLLVNGRPVKLRGACRHDIHPTLGRMTTPEYDLKDVLLAKACNMNFIRTSHYPPSEQFLAYCDKYGIYVEDETAVCFVGSHRTQAYQASGASQSDPDYTGIYLSQLAEMVNHHRNHPSVIIWSIGNENTFGTNFIESYQWMKTNDVTRPVIYSYPGQVPDSIELYDIISMHYPSWQGNLDQYGIKTKGFESADKPMLFDEWAHVACYNNYELKDDPNVRNFWGQSLDSMWTTIFETEGGLGGAIWCMLDETFMLPKDLEGYNEWWGILDKNVIPSTYMGPTVGYGEWGIIDTWRRKKPEFWGTKKAYSPTKIYMKQINEFVAHKELEVPVHNRFDHTNFNELKIVWKYGDRKGELDHVVVLPHQKGKLVFPANNWNPEEKLNICFYQNDTLLVDEYNIQLGEKRINLPVCSKGKLTFNETDGLITIVGGEFSVEVNKQNGLLQNMIMGNELLIQSGPYVNLTMPGQSIQYSTVEMDDYAKNWKLSEMQFSLVDGVAVIETKGTYDKISAAFTIRMDEQGVINIDYVIENVIADKYIQQAGVKFLTGDVFETLTWDRNAYFTAYPPDDLGCVSGDVSLSEKPEMTYRQEPQHAWAMDTKNYYYFGLEPILPYTNRVRSLKENIYSYSLKTRNNCHLEVVSNGHQACRFDKVNNENTLIINDQWDYNSLLWGNYSKQIKGQGKRAGQVAMMIGK